MKIAVVTEATIGATIGEGHELRLFEIFRRLARQHEVHILQPASAKRTWVKEGVILHDIPPLPGIIGKHLYERHFFLSRYLHAVNVIRELSKLRPEVIDVFGSIVPLLPDRSAVVGSVAYYGKAFTEKGAFSWPIVTIRDLFLKVKLKVSDYLVMMSRGSQTKLEELGYLGGKNYSYVPNGVNKDVFFPRNSAKLREELGLPNSKYIVILCGRLSEIKRPFDFLAALSAMPDGYFGLVVGRGPLENDMKKYISEHGLQHRVMLMGYVKAEILPLLYSASDVSAYMGSQEIQPLVPQESMACGTPVVASNAMGNQEIVEDGVTGKLFQPGHIEHFVSAIRSICENPEVRQRMHEQCLVFMKDRDWDTTAKMTLEAYARAIELHSLS